jgi:hypothetical protein
LTFEFDSADNTQTAYDNQRNELLVIRHDSAGRVLNVLPRGPLDGVNVTYDRQGRWTQWSRGDLTVSRVFDAKTGRLVERKLSPRSIYKYVYKNSTKVQQITFNSPALLRSTFRRSNGVVLRKEAHGGFHNVMEKASSTQLGGLLDFLLSQK